MRVDEDRVKRLLEAVRETEDEEMDCEAFLSQMGSHAEARAGGTEPGTEQARAHERLCANCREELAAVLDALVGVD
jgi:hypothetical protein